MKKGDLIKVDGIIHCDDTFFVFYNVIAVDPAKI